MYNNNIKKHFAFPKKENAKRNLCFLLKLLLIVSLSGCGSRVENDISAKLLNSDFTSAAYDSGKSFYTATELSLYKGTDNDLSTVISMTPCNDHLAVLVRISELNSGSQKSVVCLYDYAGKETSSFDISDKMDANAMILNMSSDKDGNLIVFAQGVDAKNQEFLNKLYKMNSSGSPIGNPTTISFPDKTFSASKMFIDKDGKIYFAGLGSQGMNVVYVFSGLGIMLYSIQADNLSDCVYQLGEKVYVEGTGSKENARADLLYPVNKDTGGLEKPIDVTDIFSNSILFSSTGGLYSNDTTGIYSYDFDTKTKKTELLWNDTDIDKAIYSTGSTISILSDDAIFIMSCDNNSGSDGVKISVLTRQEENPNLSKQTITIAGLYIANDPVILSAVHEFNNSSTKYRIEINDYMKDVDYSTLNTAEKMLAYEDKMTTKMYLDVLSGAGPDIIAGSSDDFSAYETNGLLTDLYAIMAKDSAFNKEDYLANILKINETSGKLYKMPLVFTMNGLVGAKSVIGDRKGWTLKEFTTMADSLPDGTSVIANCTMLELMDEALSASMKSFVNVEDGSVNFNSPEFLQIMNWAKTYGTTDDPNADHTNDQNDALSLAKSGQLALLPCTISNPPSGDNFYIEAQSSFGEDLSFVGFPSEAKASPFCVEGLVAITSWSACPNGAWDFIKLLLSEDVQKSEGLIGIPILKSALDYQIDLALHPEKIPIGADSEDSNLPDPISEEAAQNYRELINRIDTLYYPDEEILAIVKEEAPAFFTGQKSAEDVASLIQNRAQTLVEEREKAK